MIFPKVDSQETAKVLFLAYRNLVSRVAVRYAPSPSLTEDIVQQVFLEFVAKADSWDLSTDVRSLLTVMTRNVARRHWRDEMRRQPEKIQALSKHIKRIISQREPDEEHEENIEENIRQMRICMESMPEKTRDLIELHYMKGIPIKELAGEMKLNADSVYRAIYRLRKKLRLCIERALGREKKNGGVYVR